MVDVILSKVVHIDTPMLKNPGSMGGTEVAMKKDFIKIVKRWCGDTNSFIDSYKGICHKLGKFLK